MRMDAATGAQAVDRALTILGFFDEGQSELTVADVAARLGVHRSTASRLLAALERHGLLESTAAGYRLGLRVVSLAVLVLNRFPARAIARDVLGELRDTTEETAYLGLLDGDEVVYIDQASSPHVTVNVDWVGYRQSLTAGATGFLLLAFQGQAVIDEQLRNPTPGDGLPVPTELGGAAGGAAEAARGRGGGQGSRQHDARVRIGAGAARSGRSGRRRGPRPVLGCEPADPQPPFGRARQRARLSLALCDLHPRRPRRLGPDRRVRRRRAFARLRGGDRAPRELGAPARRPRRRV